MNLATAQDKIERTFEAMRAAYGAEVFDEWAVVSVGETSWTLVCYSGPRGETFRADLPSDLQPLAHTATGKVHGIGDFEFAPDARGTSHDAMMRLGASSYLVCNNTGKAMAEIRTKPRWIAAQRNFVAMSESFRVDPLMLPTE